MKKTVVFLLIGMSLILLLGLAKSNSKSQWTDSEYIPERHWQKVTNYKIIIRSDLNELQKAVNEDLDRGWSPMGGLSMVDSNCCQVMIK